MLAKGVFPLNADWKRGPCNGEPRPIPGSLKITIEDPSAGAVRPNSRSLRDPEINGDLWPSFGMTNEAKAAYPSIHLELEQPSG